jgi:hypothetical protein
VPLRLLRPGGAHLQSQQSVRVSSAIFLSLSGFLSG